MDKDIIRYLDFSTDEADTQAFQVGGDTHPKLAQYSEEIQRYMAHENPVCAVRGLIALHTVTSVGIAVGEGKSRTISNILLGTISTLLAYIAYQLSQGVLSVLAVSGLGF